MRRYILIKCNKTKFEKYYFYLNFDLIMERIYITDKVDDKNRHIYSYSIQTNCYDTSYWISVKLARN